MVNNLHIIEDFVRNVIRDPVYLTGFLSKELKTLVKEEIKGDGTLIRMKDEVQRWEMKWRDILFQYTIPFIVD